MAAASISLEIAPDGERGEYGFTCPDCSGDVRRPASRTTVALLQAAGAATHTDDERTEEADTWAMPEDDRSPVPGEPPFTLDDLIDFHFLLQDGPAGAS